MPTPNEFKQPKHDKELARALALRPWYQKKRFAFPVIGAVLAVVLGSVIIGSQGAQQIAVPANPDSSNSEESDSKSSESTQGKSGANSSAGSQPATSSETENQERARLDAKTYYESSWFSRTGMIEQLEFDGFSNEDATYGVDALGIDWGQEAIGTADSAISSEWFSRQGLIDHLVYQGFTDTEAISAVDAIGVDWFQEAAGKALDYLDYDFYTYEELVDQLIYDGFTSEEAEYGASEAEA